MRLKQTIPDSRAVALLSRIESHLHDQRRRAVWNDRQDDTATYDAALDTIRNLIRQSHTDAVAQRRADRKAFARHCILQSRAA